MKAVRVFKEETGINLLANVELGTLLDYGPQFIFALCCNDELEAEGWKKLNDSMELKQFRENWEVALSAWTEGIKKMITATPEAEKK